MQIIVAQSGLYVTAIATTIIGTRTYIYELTEGLSVFPCLAAPRSIIRCQRVRCSTVVLCLEDEQTSYLYSTCASTQQRGTWHYVCIFYIMHACYNMYMCHSFDKKKGGKG